MKLSDAAVKAILDLQKQYPEARSALIPALHISQQEVGYLPLEIQAEVAALFDIDANEVNAVVTFYDMFHEKPVGRHVLHVCKNVSCMLRGADRLIGKLCEKLDVELGETTLDGEFTIIASECLGACDRAPMAIVNEKAVGPLNEGDVDLLLEAAKKTEAAHA